LPEYLKKAGESGDDFKKLKKMPRPQKNVA
jgi:hypothetical protein